MLLKDSDMNLWLFAVVCYDLVTREHYAKLGRNDLISEWKLEIGNIR